MAKDNNGGVMAGMVDAGKALATGLPSAIVADTTMQMVGATANMNANGREALRFGVGVAITGIALALGVKPAWAIGPMVSNGAVASVQVARQMDVAGRLRTAYAPH